MDQFHILARKDIQSIYELAGKKVNFGRAESGTSMTSSVVFGALRIPVDVTTYKHKIALEKLRNGEIAAMARASAAPVSLFQEIAADEQLHLLSVPVSGSLTDTYSPVTINSDHYPAMIPEGQTVNSVGVATILISYNWPKGHPRGDTLDLFTRRFFGNYERLLEDGYHEAWQEIDISQDIPGVPRHWSAEEALKLITRDRSS
jgi:TRAP-type uncharacterized transport system substrate-binding protein